MTTTPSNDQPAERPATHRRGWSFVLVALFAVTIGFAGFTTRVGFPGPGALRRFPASELRALAERIDRVCHGTFGGAHIDWLSSRVDYPSGVPIDLNDHEREMLGSGVKVGCVGQAIS